MAFAAGTPLLIHVFTAMKGGILVRATGAPLP